MFDADRSALYQRLQEFELDDPTHEFGFTRHLMRNHGWTALYAQRAIAEYKKFAFLTVVANHRVVPSDAVDGVWHAHVLLTQSYWEEFCPKVLGKPLHHHPTRGGRAEREQFHRLYAQTIASYRHFFGSPPIDIWSPPDRRFGSELKMQRVNLTEHWVIPKRLPKLPFPQPVLAAGIIAVLTFGCVNIAYGSTPGQSVIHSTLSELIGRHYIHIVGISILFGQIVRYVIRRPSKQCQKPQLDLYQTAYLAGGRMRAVELAITQLVYRGYLLPNVRYQSFTILKALPAKAHLLERKVMQQVHQTPYILGLRNVSESQTDFIREVLEQEKLLMTGFPAVINKSGSMYLGITGLIAGLIIFVSLFTVFIFNFLAFTPVLGELFNSVLVNVPNTNMTTAFHVFFKFWSVIGLTAICCWVSFERTRWGDRILAEIVKSHDAYDVTQRFALYGTQVLSGGVLDDLKQIFKPEPEPSDGGCACGC